MSTVNPVTLTNKNPIVCPARSNNKQDIGLFDENIGNMRFVSATTEEVDEFITDRTNLIKKNGRKILTGLGIGTAIGIAASVLAGKTNKLDEACKIVTTAFAPVTGCILGTFASLLTCKLPSKLDKEFIETHK